jgi:hypothetical protein
MLPAPSLPGTLRLFMNLEQADRPEAAGVPEEIVDQVKSLGVVDTVPGKATDLMRIHVFLLSGRWLTQNALSTLLCTTHALCKRC